ncbi:MAG: SDR family NAD(P)-dependent oxidoreductase [Nitrospirae bacterium]|nr:SDR family NAD(P)-dependent oxidoreductase [Nitrospirota bacterium]
MDEAKVVLITGASSGFGKLTAELLAERGFKVFGTSRKPQSSSPTGALVMLKLDVCSDESVAACVRSVLDCAGRIDALVNNAGYQLVGALEETSLEEAKAQFETNFFGVVRMVNAVLPIMRKQREGTIVNVGSLAGLMSSPFSGFYTATKFALEGYSETLRNEVRPFGVRVALVEPGFFKTPITDAMREAAQRLDAYSAHRNSAVAVTRRSQQSGPGPEAVAQTILAILERSNPKLRHRVGLDSKVLPVLKAVLPAPLVEWGTRVNFGLNRKP